MRLKAIRRGLRRALPWLFLAAVAAMTLYMDVYVARNILDGDASDFMCRGYEIARSGNPFPTDYYYTTELKLVDSSLIFSIFFHFTENWTLVRFLGTALMQGLYVLSFLFLCRSARLTWGVSATSAAFLLLPFSTPYARIVLYHVHYINYLSEAFLLLGLTMRLMDCREWRKRILPAVALATLWVFVGTNGIRHMMILGAPMLVFVGVYLLRELRRYTWERGRLAGEPSFAQTAAARLTVIMLASCVCFLIGFLIYSKVLVPRYDLVPDTTNGFYSPKSSARVYAAIPHGWLQAVGARPVHLSLVGLPGIALVCALFSFSYLLWASFKGMTPRDSEPTPPRLMCSMYLWTMIVNTLIFVLDGGTTRSYVLYYVPVVAFALPTLALELGKLRERAVSAARKLMIVLTCACFLFQGGYTCRYMLGSHELDRWTGVPLSDINLVKYAQEYTDVILNSGYTHVLATWWYANTMMELADGKVKIAPGGCGWEDNIVVAGMDLWGTSKTNFARENLPETLLLLSNDPTLIDAANQPRIELYHTFSYPNGSEVYLYTFPSKFFRAPND